MLHLGNNILLIRQLSGTTQEEFGSKLGASKAMIVSYEKGKASPSELFVSRLSKMSGVSENKIKNNKLSESDIDLNELEKVYKIEKGENLASNNFQVEKVGKENRPQDRPETAITSLSESNRLIAESNASLARSNEALVSLLKERTANAPVGTDGDWDVFRNVAMDFLFGIAGGTKYRNEAEARSTFGKMLSDVSQAKKKKGSHV